MTFSNESVGNPRFSVLLAKSIFGSSSPPSCAVRFWSSEFLFVFVFIIFFPAVRSRPLALHEKACATGRPVEGILGRSLRPAPCGSRLWRARGRERWQNGFENITKRGAGTRILVAQTESCGVERSPICAGTEAQRERSGDESSRSKWASKRNAALIRLRDKFEFGAA